MVYESAGDIWYSRSTDNGVNWSQEFLVTDGTGASRNPSMFVEDGTVNFVRIVWAAAHDIYYREYCYGIGWNPPGAGWHLPENITNDLVPTTQSTPVVGKYGWVAVRRQRVPDRFGFELRDDLRC